MVIFLWAYRFNYGVLITKFFCFHRNSNRIYASSRGTTITMARKSINTNVTFSSNEWHLLFIRICMLFFFFCLIISCTPVMGIIYGVHQPRYVSDSNIAHYAEKIDLKGDIYRLKDYAEENRSKYRYLGKRLPETLIFNTDGLLTKFDIDCDSDLYSNAILSVGAIDSMETGDQSFQDLIADSYLIDTLKPEETIVFNSPVYVIKFAEFVGKFRYSKVVRMYNTFC